MTIRFAAIDENPDRARDVLQAFEAHLYNLLVAADEKLLTQKLDHESYLGQFASRRELAALSAHLRREMRKWGIETRADRHRGTTAPEPAAG